MKKTLMIMLASLAVAGCAAIPTTLIPVGGSRSDGTVSLSYQMGVVWRADIDWEAAQDVAEDKCRMWGYDSAEAFGGGESQCTMSDDTGCYRRRYTYTYQCVKSDAVPEVRKPIRSPSRP